MAETKYEGGRFSGAIGGKARFFPFLVVFAKVGASAFISFEGLASTRENLSR